MSAIDSAQQAARITDPVEHGLGLVGVVGGALLGLAVGALLVIGGVVTGGALIAVVVAGCIAGGGLAGGQLARGIQRAANLDTQSGAILVGSPNVRIGGLPAARAKQDYVAECNGSVINHFSIQQTHIAEGSATVRINGRPAARVSSRLTCGAKISHGHENVYIGGPTQQALPVFDAEELSETMLKILGLPALALGIVAAPGAFVAAIAGYELLGLAGDRIGPGWRDILQGAGGLLTLGVAGRRGWEGSVRQKAPSAFGARGPKSGRDFDPENAGGPIRNLSAEQIKITPKGIDVVERHLSRFGEYKPNEIMVKRLRAIADGTLEPTSSDKNFYSHELREFVRYRQLGYESGVPTDKSVAHDLWNNAHTATLEDYRLNESVEGVLYHPDTFPYD